MKKNRQNIIDFFEGNLSEKETADLLKQLELNPDLKSEFEKFEKLYKLLNDSIKIIPNDDYLENLMPKFKLRLIKNHFRVKYIFAISILMAFISLGVLLYNIYVFDYNKSDISQNSKLNESGIVDYESMQYFIPLISQSDINEIFFKEFINEEYPSQSLSNNNYITENDYSIICEIMGDEVYESLSNKKIL